MTAEHERYMRVALSMARRQLGQTAPNPCVGAVLVNGGQIVATGATAKGGRPHAETITIKNAGNMAQGATLYVTLEPCSHHGKTPPCVDAIIAAEIKTVVIACRDKNPQVAGNGITALRNAGIEVIENICHKEGLEVNQGFFSVIEKNRPYIALKIATSLDSKITNPKERWITGETARNYGQLLRSQHDAILTGSGTAIEDDPLLTCRLAGLEQRSPIRIVLDRSGKISKDAKIFPALILSEPTIEKAIEKISEQGITRLLVEAGAKLTTAFLESGMVDKIYWFRAPIIIGDGGLSAAGALEKLAEFKQIEHIKLGNDLLEIYECSQE